MIIRFAKDEDSREIFRLICELEETEFEYVVFEGYYRENICNKDYIYLVAADDGGEVIGYLSCHGQILLHHMAKVFEIQELFVKENYRNQKVGQLLIQSLEEQLKKEGYRFLEVTANIKRLNTHRFYIKCGFVQTHLKFTKTLD
jgi:PhnO protein